MLNTSGLTAQRGPIDRDTKLYHLRKAEQALRAARTEQDKLDAIYGTRAGTESHQERLENDLRKGRHALGEAAKNRAGAPSTRQSTGAAPSARPSRPQRDPNREGAAFRDAVMASWLTSVFVTPPSH
jgi:hypothetical protein